MAKRILFVGFVLGSLGLMLAGCMQLASLGVAPTSAIVEGGDTVTFIATDHLGNPVTVTWNVASGPGSITSAGVYTAPAVTAVTNATITASRVDRPAITASATVTIKPPIPPITATLVDGLGDSTATPYDVVSIKTSRTSTTLTATINFTTIPTMPVPGNLVSAGNLAGFICFDTDENAATGWPSANHFYCPCAPASPEFGADYFIHLFSRNALGHYDIISTATGVPVDVGDAVPSVTSSVLTLTIPLTELGADDGITDMNAVFGDNVGPTDCVPDEVAAVVTGKSLEPKAIVIEGYPYYDFLQDLGVTGWVQTRSSTL
ncbi:TPA: hypothetical protein DIT45_03970 [Candidatus Acetothermia bacterium]|nr:hypothetical protein [Candidatus Acetothermia bacterium]